ncbi:hypothetical protein [Actinoplanes sp. NPDC049681]|uniref:hypothetical protein n=1 Tax=Actinoplanes sp. NPDC049681 TaxID=3363905 RepID=UPI0037B2A401
MSAWIVSRDHLDLLLTAAIAWEITPPGEADRTGQMLWKEDLASVAYRYPHDRDGDRPGPIDFRDGHVDTYHFQPYPGQVDPEVVAAATVSLAYQSCENLAGRPAPHAGGPRTSASRQPPASRRTSTSTPLGTVHERRRL